jgi:hypothetical protein
MHILRERYKLNYHRHGKVLVLFYIITLIVVYLYLFVLNAEKFIDYLATIS